jgi:DNA invertase Pin-like site-specific DNA recombinase
MKKAYGYIRVSTEGQAADGVSMEAQEAKVKAWADLNGFPEVVIFRDAGISGKRADNRAGLQDALSVIEDGDALVVYSLSRMSRSTKDTIEIAEALEKKGADLVSISERIDTTTAAGKMVFRMLAVLNEFERDQVSERTKAAMAHKKTENERIGRIPFGYCLAADGIHLEESEREQWILSEIRGMKKAGLSLRKIADELNERGIANREGRTWNHVAVKRVAKL